MMSLGWGLGKWKAEYQQSLRRLSPEESELVEQAAKTFIICSQNREISSKSDAAQLAQRSLAQVCEDAGYALDSDQQQYLARAIYLQTYGAGFLEELLADPSLEEIAINGLCSPVFVFVRGKGWKMTSLFVESQEYFVSLVNHLGRNLGRRLTAGQPRLNAVLEDGSRIHASMPPISPCELTVRRFSSEPLSPFDLVRLGTYSPRALAAISLAMQCDLSVVFAGNTASGKTSSLNALLSCIPSSERLLLIEETPEISVPHPHQLRLVPFLEGGIGMAELVQDSLRMRPDRVVVGEVRSPGEARAFLESVLSGQSKGCYTTFHAQSAQEALMRLRMMGCLESDLSSISLLVIQRRVSLYDRGKRKTGEARKLMQIAIANRASPMQPITVFDGKKFSESAAKRMHEAMLPNSSLSRKEMLLELNSRERFFASKNTGGYARAFGKIQDFLFKGDSAV